ncbi:phosphotransferase family protein [Bacillus sp. FJAT-42376]|uniref:phosphotransferase family protein n=1 Tax=Bacillus sp. FJAT-42376 TaxID=2014076 RepID=UPI000F506705|nr:phosphotransferase family protein [Bacillus sp. FJAT-42376]AZB44008.1 phosphotransferase family protein [Bacillus sp. FJAT-42376]
MSYTIPVREGEELKIQELERYLKERFPAISDDSLRIEQFGTGASNLTYALKAGKWEAVLRRPPLGPVAPKAHDMKREFRILKALHPLFPEAPKPYLYEEDPSVAGSAFFLMERRKGVIVDTSLPAGIELTEERGRILSELMVDKLVQLHAIPYQNTDLVNLSRPEGFMERQVGGWIERYHRAKTDEIEEVAILTSWLEKHLPSSGAPSVIHYDYKLNNALFTEDLTDMAGLFDWEMTTIGDPLADLGAAMSYWTDEKDPDSLKFGFGKPSITIQPSFYSRKQFVDRYAEKSGRDVSSFPYYLAFAYFKLAVICQQIYYRYKKGQTKDERFAKFAPFVHTLIHQALSTAKGTSHG